MLLQQGAQLKSHNLPCWGCPALGANADYETRYSFFIFRPILMCYTSAMAGQNDHTEILQYLPPLIRLYIEWSAGTVTSHLFLHKEYILLWRSMPYIISTPTPPPMYTNYPNPIPLCLRLLNHWCLNLITAMLKCIFLKIYFCIWIQLSLTFV